MGRERRKHGPRLQYPQGVPSPKVHFPLLSSKFWLVATSQYLCWNWKEWESGCLWGLQCTKACHSENREGFSCLSIPQAQFPASPHLPSEI